MNVAQKAKITSEVMKRNTSFDLFRKAIAEVIIRLENTRKAGFHIEAALINAQLVEHSLKHILHSCELERSITGILGLPDPYPYGTMKDKKELERFRKGFSNFDRSELGKLIVLFRQATGELALATELESFNTFRITLAHHVFSGEYNIDLINQQASDHLDLPETAAMIIKMIDAYDRVKATCENLYFTH